MRTDELMSTLTEIQRRWMDNIIYPNVDKDGERRHNSAPWYALIVMGDLGAEEGHECEVHDPSEGCVAAGHDNYQFVAWIDYMGRAHYLDPAVSAYRQ